MRVLVTGGSGFLGAWIMRRLLARGIDCVAFDLHAKPQLLQALAPEHAAAAQCPPDTAAAAPGSQG